MNFDIVYILGIVLLAFGLIVYSSKRKIKKANDNLDFVLKLPEVIKYFGYIFLIVVFYLLLSEIPKISRYELAPFLLMIFCVVLISIYLILVVDLNETRINDEYILQKSFGKKHILKWSEIENVKLSPFFGYMILSNSNNKKIKVSAYNIGFSYFVNEVKKRTKYQL